MNINYTKLEKQEKVLAVSGDILVTEEILLLVVVDPHSDEHYLIDITNNKFYDHWEDNSAFYVGRNLNGEYEIEEIIKSGRVEIVIK